MKNIFIISLLLKIIMSTNASVAHFYGVASNERKIPFIRVKIKNGSKKIKVRGIDIKRISHLTHEAKFYGGRKIISFNCDVLARKVDLSGPTLVASFASSTGLLTVKNDKFQGLVHIVTSKKDGHCDVIHETDLESYLGGLLSKEMNASWPVEALKAQAVAARTYAYHKIKTYEVAKKLNNENFYHIENSEKHQVSGSFFDTTNKTKKVAKSTYGEVLLDHKGKLSSIFFHAKCGGKTLLPHQVWQNTVVGYRSVICPFCNKKGGKYWKYKLSRSDWRDFLKWAVKLEHLPFSVKYKVNKKLRVVKSKKWDRYVRIYLGDHLYRFKKSLFRRYFGRFKIKSNNFSLAYRSGVTRIVGEGRGHGVGMCQMGALDLAKKGWGYKKILAHYFPKYNLKKIY